MSYPSLPEVVKIEASTHEPVCVLCRRSLGAGGALSVTPAYRVLYCEPCGVHQTDPFPQNTAAFYQESYYSRQKSHRFVAVLEYGIKWFRMERALDLRRRYPKGRILDVGCGRGLMLSYLRNYFGWQVQGTQLSRTAYQYAIETLKIPVFLGELSDLQKPAGSFSVVTLYHVLEHLTDPKAYLKLIYTLLEDKGACVIEVPNTASWSARWTRQNWMGWDVPYHTVHFNPNALTRLFEESGFHVEQVKHWSVEFSSFIVLQSILNSLFSEKDYFFRLLQRKARISQHPLKAISCLIVGCLLVPVSAGIAIAGALAGAGEVIRIYARKKD